MDHHLLRPGLLGVSGDGIRGLVVEMEVKQRGKGIPLPETASYILSNKATVPVPPTSGAELGLLLAAKGLKI